MRSNRKQRKHSQRFIKSQRAEIEEIVDSGGAAPGRSSQGAQGPSQGEETRSRTKRTAETDRDFRPSEKRGHVDDLVELTSNAFPISFSPNFGKLYVFTVKFDGPRMSLRLVGYRRSRNEGADLDAQVCMASDMYEWLEVKYRQIIKLAACPKLVQWRDALGAKLYIVDRDGNGVNEVRELSFTEVPFKRRPRPGQEGEPESEEVWTLIFQEENAELGGLTNETQQPSVWMQFLTLLSEAALDRAKFTLVGNQGRMVRLDTSQWLRLRNDGHLAPGYSKSMALTSNGMHWAFAPRYTLMLSRSMDDELRDMMRQDPGLASHDRKGDLGLSIRRRNMFAVTPYSPANMYKILDVCFDKSPTDSMEVREKVNGEWVSRSTTHIEYLREKYASEYRQLENPDLERATMVACVLTGRRKQMVKNSKQVFIPSPLLNICCLDTRDLAKNIKEEVTRFSQRREKESYGEIAKLMDDLRCPEIQETFQTFGLVLGSSPTHLQGQNILRPTVTISLCPPDSSGKQPSPELYLDDNGNFTSDFSRNRKHSRTPRIGGRYLIFARLGRDGRLNEPAMNTFLGCLQETVNDWKWDLKISNDPSQVPVVRWDGTSRELDDHADDLAKRILKRPESKPVLLFFLLLSKDESDYALAKRFSWKFSIPSQCITIPVILKHRGKAIFRMLASLAAKVVPTQSTKPGSSIPSIPWKVANALGDRENVTVCAISTYRKSNVPSEGRRVGGFGGFGITMTTSDDCTSIIQDFGETNSLSPGGMFGDLKEKFQDLIHRLKYKFDRKIETLLIYRQGISQSVFDDVLLTECKMIDDALDEILGCQIWDASSRTLTIAFPGFKEKGLYTLDVPCAFVNSKGMKATKIVQKKVQSSWKLSGSTTKTIQLISTFEAEDGIPDLTIANIAVRLPDTDRPMRLPRKPSYAIVAVNHAHSANLTFFKKNLGSSQGRNADSIPCGTIVDRYFRGIDSCGKAREEFFIIPSTGVVGFASPIHYCILQNQCPLSTREIEQISLRLCFLYYNQFMANKVPFLVRIAEKGAEQAVTLYEGLTTAQPGEKRGSTKQWNELTETHLFL